MEACLVVLRGCVGRADGAPVYQPAIPAVWRVPDALARVRALLAAHPAGGVLHQFLPPLAADEPDPPVTAGSAPSSMHWNRPCSILCSPISWPNWSSAAGRTLCTAWTGTHQNGNAIVGKCFCLA